MAYNTDNHYNCDNDYDKDPFIIIPDISDPFLRRLFRDHRENYVFIR